MHAEVPIAHLIVRGPADPSDPLDGLVEIQCNDRGAWGDRALARADDGRPGSAPSRPTTASG